MQVEHDGHSTGGTNGTGAAGGVGANGTGGVEQRREADRVVVFDTTLRDGEQSPGCSMTMGEKVRIAGTLARLGVDVIEAGFPIASEGDFEGVREVARRVGNEAGAGGRAPSICGLARCQRGDILRAGEAVREAARPRIHVFLATSAIHREHKLRMATEEIVRRTREGVALARELCEDVEFSPEDASRTEPDFLAEVVEAAIEAGASTLNIPDTVGYAVPEEYAETFRMLRKTVRGIDRVVLSAHCHDDLGLASANSLAAVGAGARQVECTVNGIGERAGNACLEEVVMALRVRGPALGGAWTGVRTELIGPTSRAVSAVTGSNVARNKAIVGENAFAHEAGIHQHGMIANRATYEIMRAEDVGASEGGLVLGKHSGKHAVRKRIEELGHAVDEAELVRVVERVKALADRKKAVYDADLEAILLGHETGEEGPWRLLRLTTSGGTQHLQTASVEMERTTGENAGDRRAEAAVGDGPVDALFQAICRATGVELRLRDYRVRSVSSGEDAQGEAVVDLEYAGVEGPQVFRGRGVSTDIVEASALAVLEVANRVVTMQERRAAQPDGGAGAGVGAGAGESEIVSEAGARRAAEEVTS